MCVKCVRTDEQRYRHVTNDVIKSVRLDGRRTFPPRHFYRGRPPGHFPSAVRVPRTFPPARASKSTVMYFMHAIHVRFTYLPSYQQ